MGYNSREIEFGNNEETARLLSWIKSQQTSGQPTKPVEKPVDKPAEKPVEASAEKTMYQKVLDKISAAKESDNKAAEERFGGMTTDELFSYAPTDERDKTLYETYMNSRTKAGETLDRQSRQAMSDAATAGFLANDYRSAVGMPGASDEEIYGLAQAIRENNAQAKSLEPQRWLEYAEGLKESEEKKQALTEQGRELGARAAAASEQGQAWEYSNIINSYGELINSPDYAAKSQYIAPKESSDEIWKKDKNDQRLRYMAINGDSHAQVALEQEAWSTGDRTGAGNIFDLGGDNDYLFELTDTEKGIYNALYASSPEAADNFIEKLKPYLEVRARDTYTKRMAKIAQETPVGASVMSVATNLGQSGEYVLQLAELLGKGRINQNSAAYRASQMSNAVRGEVSKMAEEKWGKVGSAAYNLGMSMADFLTTTALSGGSKALDLALMGTRAASNTVLNLKDRGLDDASAFTLGTIAGAAEIVTESFSLEKLLNPDLIADGIAKNILKNILAEGSEEGASDLINWAAEAIYDAITGNNAAEWKQKAYEAIQNGADPNEAVLAAIQDNLIQLGTDMLGGGISGGIMSGAGTPLYLNSFNNSQQGQYANAIRGNEEGLQALIQSGLESPQGTASNQQAQAAQAQVDKGKTPSTLSIARLVEANQQQIDNETAEQSGQGKFRLALPRTAPQTTDTQAEAPAPPIPQNRAQEETPRLTLQQRTEGEQQTAETPRLTLPTRSAQSNELSDAKARAAQAESDLVTKLRASKPGLLMDDYATSKLDENQRRAIDETAKRLGLRVAFSDTVSLGEDNAKIYGDGVVLIEKNNPNPVGFLYGHEMGHWLKQNSADAYREFAEAARATDPEWFKTREEETASAYRNAGIEMSPESIQEEVLSDYAGWLVQNQDVLDRFINQNKDKPNILRRLYEAIKALAAKLTGKDKQQAESAADLLLKAMNATEANVQNGIMSTGETHSSFGGVKAVYPDFAARDEAERLLGKSEGSAKNNWVRKKTGWFKGADGKWRFEIDDSGSRVKVDDSMKYLSDMDYELLTTLVYRDNGDDMLYTGEAEKLADLYGDFIVSRNLPYPSAAAQKIAMGEGTVGDILDHEELYRQYPWIAEIPIRLADLGETTQGQVQYGAITLNTRFLDDKAELRKTLLHEIQHIIQEEEGFAKGTNPRYWQRKIDSGMDTTRPSDVSLLNKYASFKEKHPDLIRTAKQLEQMFDDNWRVYKRDGDDWVNRETGEVFTQDEVWGEYNKLQAKAEAKYGRLYDEYYETIAKLGGPEEAERAAAEGPERRTAYDLYQDTYGEAEARNVEWRADLNAEQRTRVPPFSGDEDSVFVEKHSQKGLNADTAPASMAADGFPSDAKQFDDDYMNALSNDDTDTMSNMIHAAAVRAGYDSPLLMHGTAQFGFTSFDKNKVDDHLSFFMTADKRTAGSYYHGPDEIREIRTFEPRVDYSSLSPERLLDEAMAVNYPLFANYKLLDNDGKAEALDAARSTITVMKSVVKEAKNKAGIDQGTGEVTSEEALALFGELSDAMEALERAGEHDEIVAAWSRINDAVHDLEVLGLDTFLTPDIGRFTDYTRGPSGDQLYFDYDELEHAKDLLDNLTLSEALYRDYDVTLSLSPYASTYIRLKPASVIVDYLNSQPHRQSGIYQFYCSPGKQLVIDCDNSNWDNIQVSQDIRKELHFDGRVTTRQVSKAAHDHGYDSVRFKDIRDNGGHTEWFGASDVYIYFDGRRVKSADPITIDDNGEVIRPSERFKPINDFRRSLKGLDADIAPASVQKNQAKPRKNDRVERLKFKYEQAIEEQKGKTFQANAQRNSDLARQKREFQEKSAEQRERANERLERTKFKYEQALEEQKGKTFQERARRYSELAAQKREFQEKEAKGREARRAQALRSKIASHTKSLLAEYQHPNNKHHVPENLRGAVNAVLSAINMSSGYSLAEGEEGKQLHVPLGDGVAETKRTQAFAQLRSELENERQNLVFDWSMIDDADGALNRLIGELADTPIANMNSEQLQTVSDVLHSVEQAIKTADKMLSQARSETVSGFANALLDENGGKKQALQLNGKLGNVLKHVSLDILPPEAYFHRLGGSGKSIFKMLRNGQDNYIRTIQAASDATKSILKGEDVRKLETDKHTVTLGGSEVTMSTAQLMELYCLMQRDQGMQHITTGGIVVEPSRRGIKKNTQIDPIHPSVQELNDAIDMLTPEQIQMAEAMQKYLTEDMSNLGNEATMQVYGYKKFGREDNYWKIRSNKNELQSDPERFTQTTSVANKGFTKATKPNANTSVLIGSAFDTFSQSISDMASYAAWLATSEDLNRILNYTFWGNDGNRITTIQSVLDRVQGSGGANYFKQLLADIANGVQNDAGLTEGFVGAYKAAAIGTNIRVVAQQPTAILRAMEMIDPKYFVNVKDPFKAFERAKKYAPIAQWKDWGYFDINTGRKMKDVLMESSESALEKARQASVSLAGKADSWAWGILWNAVERETAKTTSLTPGSEEFYQHCAERFSDIIDHTQVVDGIIQRSPIQRSTNSINKMASSFMSEPLKQYGQFMSAVYDVKAGKQGAGAHLVRTTMAMAAAGLLNNAVQSLVDALRDDDKEKKYWEKFLEKFLGYNSDDDTMRKKIKTFLGSNMGELINPAEYIPYAKDVMSVYKGYDVERMDMSIVSDLVTAVNRLQNTLAGDTKYTTAYAVASVTEQLAKLTGLPAANIDRDIKSVINTVANEADMPLLQYYMNRYKFKPSESGNLSDDLTNILWSAKQKGDEDYQAVYDRLIKDGYSEEKINAAMMSKMSDTTGLTQAIKDADAANNANKSYDTLEILSAFESLDLPQDEAEILLEWKLSEGQWEKYNTLKDADISYDTRFDIMKTYSTLNADDEMKSSDKALEFSNYVDGLNLTSEQTQTVKDTYKFWSMVPAEATRYETFKTSGLSEDKSKHMTEVLSALTPEPGKEAVTDLQRYRAIAADDVLTDGEKLKAIGSIMGTEMVTEKGNPTTWAKFNTALNNGQSLSQAIDLYENGRLDEFEKWTKSEAKGQKVEWSVYDKFLKDTATFDGKENGVSVNGLLKERVVAYIEHLNLTIDQKKALLKDYNKSYKDDVTWHNGSYGPGYSKTYAKANLSRLELPRTNTATARLQLPSTNASQASSRLKLR